MSTLHRLPAPWRSLDWVPAGLELADLSWWGADHELWRATDLSGTPLLAKLPRDHLAHGGGAEARRRAAELGLGPEVLLSDSSTGLTIEVDLGPSWRVATLWRVRDPEVVRAIGTARGRFRAAEVDLPLRDVGEEVQQLVDLLTSRGIPLQADTSVLDAVPTLREAVTGGAAPVPGWLSAEISDVLLHRDGQVRLTGGTSAGLADPLADVGALLTELVPLVGDSEEMFALLWGDADPVAHARARVWGVLADLRDYLRAERLVAEDPTSALSFGGYRTRKLWRAEVALRSGELERLLEVAAHGQVTS